MNHFAHFLPVSDSIHAARSMVRSSLDLIDDAEVAQLLASELSANAVLHARTPFTVAVVHDLEGRVTVEVHDDDPTLPLIRPLDANRAGGRGLRLVDALSREWGVTMVHDDGKTVWFRLSARADLAAQF